MTDFKIPGAWTEDGVLYGPAISKEALSELKTFEMNSGDVLVTAYPKAGEGTLEYYQNTRLLMSVLLTDWCQQLGLSGCCLLLIHEVC